jgi:isochorismate synthase
VGATPELLVGRCGDRVRSSALAGSAPRGRTPQDDARHARELRESKKENEEHALVVRAIVESLAPLCDRLDVAESPRLLRLQGIQHLHTPIEGVLRPGSLPALFELGARLHPTPAVAGSPRRAALDWIDRFEGLDRGWYAAPVGFVGPDGAGELRVALRSALLRQLAEGDEARLFAGGGILADSDPDRELEETRIKLRALLAPLTEI